MKSWRTRMIKVGGEAKTDGSNVRNENGIKIKEEMCRRKRHIMRKEKVTLRKRA